VSEDPTADLSKPRPRTSMPPQNRLHREDAFALRIEDGTVAVNRGHWYDPPELRPWPG
jgi:hypothetical protein